jgi:hypothetical protein
MQDHAWIVPKRREDGSCGPSRRVPGSCMLWCWMDMQRDEYPGPSSASSAALLCTHAAVVRRRQT